jgi:NAD(P)-dependent dehydrogenase (short-subunit alcohol dehydrogenase family)
MQAHHFPNMTQHISKVVLVTGAARRIGRTIALAFARRGWDVVVHYNRSADAAQQVVQEIRALGRQAEALCCELADEQAVRTLLTDAAYAMHGRRVDCLVNNASLFVQDDATSFNYAQLDAHMRVNLGAPLLLAQALHAATPENAQACVINILDQKLFNLNPDFLSYTLSKAGLNAATTMLAQALAPKLRVVGVAPGISLVSGDQTAAGFEKAHKMTPLGRSSTPEDIADAVLFAANNPAMTGTTLVVDGGQHLIPLQRDVMFITN